MGDAERGGGRREQIVEAVLELLAEAPIEQLTTRRIAERLGLTQPALFRHFQSREEILLAVVGRARTTMTGVAATILAESNDPVERIRTLARRIALEIERTPGLPRLLFLVVESGELSDALQALVGMLAALVAELVRDGQRIGQLAASVAPEDAATLFIGLVQGLALQARLHRRDSGLEHDAGRLIGLLLDGMRPPPGGDGGSPAGGRLGAEETTEREEGVRVLDLRPILASGRDPLGDVLHSLAQLSPGSALVIVAPFRPTPLVTLLTSRGHAVAAREAVPGTWSVDVVVGGSPAIVDLTDLEPPEPFERVLLAAELLPANAVYLARVPRYPQLLVARLSERQVRFAVERDVDGTALVWIRGGL